MGKILKFQNDLLRADQGQQNVAKWARWSCLWVTKTLGDLHFKTISATLTLKYICMKDCFVPFHEPINVTCLYFLCLHFGENLKQVIREKLHWIIHK